VQLSRALVGGQPAAEPYPYDPVNGLVADNTPFPTGAATATAGAQPKPVQRLQRAEFTWHGGVKGEDRPLDRAFVRIERRAGRAWRAYDSDLGLSVLWEVDDDGNYRALWEVPLDAPAGKYRFRITANRYELASGSFAVTPSTALTVEPASAPVGRSAVRLAYPVAITERDLTYRPRYATGGTVTFRIADRRVVVKRGGQTFSVASGGGTAFVPVGAARDRYGNTNAVAASIPETG
jgi:hypothetical protein